MRKVAQQVGHTVARVIRIVSNLSVVVRLGLASLGIVLAVSPNTVMAATVTSALGMDFPDPAQLKASGNIRLFVYSTQSRSIEPPIAPIGPNGTVTSSSRLGGVNGGPLATVTGNQSPPITISTGVIGDNQAQMLYGDKPKQSERTVSYAPTVATLWGGTSAVDPKNLFGKDAIKKQTLTRAGDNVTLTSTSGNYTAEAKALITDAAARQITAKATKSANNPGGNAAARAIDPFNVPSGTAFVYDPTLDAHVQLDPGVRGGIEAWATDTSVLTSESLDNFGAVPFDQTLWYLAVGGQLLNDTFSLFIDFELNPLALSEIQYPSSFLASLPSFTDNVSEALAISAATTDFIVSQLALNGAAGLTAVHLFPAGTLFTAREGGVQYGSAVGAVLTASEPPSLALVALAVLCLVVLRRSINVRNSARYG